jgi:hypothetical protein
MLLFASYQKQVAPFGATCLIFEQQCHFDDCNEEKSLPALQLEIPHLRSE